MPKSERVKLVIFDVSMDDPSNHLSHRHGDICLGWIPWRALKVWGVLEALPKKLEKQFVMAGMGRIDSRKHSSLTREWTPFQGFRVDKKNIAALARVYGREEQNMKYFVWENLIILRNIFLDRFGEDACKWWEHIEAELNDMRSEGLPADAIFFLTDVAFCEICLRKALINEGQEREKGLMKIIRTLENLREEKELQDWFFCRSFGEAFEHRRAPKAEVGAVEITHAI